MDLKALSPFKKPPSRQQLNQRLEQWRRLDDSPADQDPRPDSVVIEQDGALTQTRIQSHRFTSMTRSQDGGVTLSQWTQSERADLPPTGTKIERGAEGSHSGFEVSNVDVKTAAATGRITLSLLERSPEAVASLNVTCLKRDDGFTEIEMAEGSTHQKIFHSDENTYGYIVENNMDQYQHRSILTLFEAKFEKSFPTPD